GGGDPGPGSGDPGPGSGDSGPGGGVILPPPGPTTPPTDDDDGHEHIYGIPVAWGENLHIRHCTYPGCPYSITQRHVFREIGEVEPSDGHPNGGILYHCPFCGYDYIQDNEAEALP
ncbi:MAG: hypothetical protein IJH09_11570, partial [Clostridia bacterium]|nr:hypothetical protein [Clostridia bacterium]